MKKEKTKKGNSATSYQDYGADDQMNNDRSGDVCIGNCNSKVSSKMEEGDENVTTRDVSCTSELYPFEEFQKKENFDNTDLETDLRETINRSMDIETSWEEFEKKEDEIPSYCNQHMLQGGEDEISDISTDEMLSGMESDSDVLDDAKELSKDEESVYEHFNSDEISALSREILTKEKLLEETNKKIWNLKNRFSKIEKYINNKKKQITKTKKMIEEKSKTEAEERGICQNIQVKNDFLERENEKLKLEREKNNEKIVKTQNDLLQCDNNIEEIKKKLINKEKELKEWIDKINKLQKEEFEIEKFTLSKDKEIKNLTYKLEKLCLERVEQEKKVSAIKTKNMQLSMELQASVRRNEEMEEEKKNLQIKWKCIVDTINNRDQTIYKFEEEFQKYLKKKEKLTQKYASINQHIDAQKMKNNELNDKIKREEMYLNKLQNDRTKVEDAYKRVHDERDILFKDLECEKIASKEKFEEKKNLQISLDDLEKTYEKLITSYEESKKEQMKEELNNVEKNKLIKSNEQILKEENKLAKLNTEIKALDEEKFRLYEILKKSKNDYIALESDMVGTQIKIKQIKNNIKKTEQELERQKEILYKFDFQTQVLTKKLNVASGISTFETKKKSQKKIITLEKELNKYEEIYITLNNEIKRINIELKNIKTHQTCLIEEKCNIHQEIENLELEIKSLESAVSNQNKEKENVMLIEMNVKIELAKIKEIFSKNLNNLNLLRKKKKENFKNEKLSEQDMNAHVESLKAIIKNMKDEIHKLNIHVYDKKSKCNNLELKLDAINVISREEKENEQECNNDISIANHPYAQGGKEILYKIKIEEDITKLKKEIKTIDEEIERGNEQICKFQKTLNDIIQTNKSFSDNIKCIDPQYKLFLKKKNKLNKKMNEIKEEISFMEKEINEYKKKISVVENQLNTTLMETKSVEDKVTLLKENCSKMEVSINEIFVKIKRSSDQLKGLLGAEKKMFKNHSAGVQSTDHGEVSEMGDESSLEGKSNNHSENVTLEKKIFKQIQMESLKEKIDLLLECFKNYGDNTVVEQIYHVIEASE
ncbi:hypothetical protein, conserved [Plasmodium gonderi]|uniref:Uncharacterized protein n=1 Tax=Plasmodium gonderi TaxID=77519 RepID=A0A1Y1JAT2_PLAGO|nr:hypothetical protein, conserved [Plasmodium gonderi]GAW79619.1 hypothetical protein, conserved [Plasmodium gonderi]